MATVLDIVQQHLGPQEIQQISEQLGTDEGTAQQAVNAAPPSSAEAPHPSERARSRAPSHGGIPAASSASAPDGGGILGQVLGQHGPAVQDGVQQAIPR